MPDDVLTIELNPRERRLYDRVRRQIARVQPGESSGIRDLLLLLPDFTVLLARLLREPRVPRRAKWIAMIGLGYVLSPIDLLPSLVFGPIGLVDDVVVAAAALSRLLNDVHPDLVRSHWPGKGDALEAIQRVTRWSESLFSVRLRGVLASLFRR
jgi:uncharacterized membrane protein YkvA (DUF1232 family)